MSAITPAMDFTSRILIVDDDPGIRESIAEFLATHGYRADGAASAREMRNKLADGGIDLVVLDLMMPQEDGLSALGSLRGADAPPVIMLSAMASDVDRIVGLELGADDYLAKPCNPRELLARIRTVLRRKQRADAPAADETPPATSGSLLCFSGWRLDIIARTLRDPGGVLVNLSDGEFRLLKALAEHPRRVLSRDQLLDFSRGDMADSYDRSIDVQMSRLRRKLAAGSGAEELIRTIRSEGYMFTPVVRRG